MMNAIVGKYLETFDSLLDVGVPGIYQIYKEANNSFKKNNISEAKKAEQLIYFLHNSIVYAECNLGKVDFAYGGIGVVIHKKTVIGRDCIIGTNVTIGGKLGYDKLPRIGNNVDISTGAKIIGDVTIGNNVIVGTNAVVIKNVPNNAIVAGVPAKNIRIK